MREVIRRCGEGTVVSFIQAGLSGFTSAEGKEATNA